MAAKKASKDLSGNQDSTSSNKNDRTTTRSIKVKLDLQTLPEPERIQLTEALKNTHEIYHAGVRYYQDWLLLMRQEDVYFSHEDVQLSKTGAQYSSELWKAVQEARKRNAAFLKASGQKANFAEIKGRQQEILGWIRQYFNYICPAGGGDEEAKGFLNALVSIEASVPGEGTGGRNNAFQQRMQNFLKNNPKIKEKIAKADNITRDQLESLFKKASQLQATFTQRQLEEFEHVQKGYDEVSKRKAAKAQGLGQVVKDLKAYGVLPLFPRYLRNEKGDIPAYLSTQGYNDIKVPASFEYSMWSRAVASIRGWNTWDTNQKKKRSELAEKFKKDQEILSDIDPEEQGSKALQAYENQRNQELKQIAENPDDAFFISSRVIRALDEVIEAWKKDGATEEDRLKQLASLQTKLRGRFGDPDFFRWLAKEENRHIWENGSKLIRAHVYLNRSKQELLSAKPYAVMTRTDPYAHPVWYNLEGPKIEKGKKTAGAGNNQPTYDIEQSSDQTWTITVPLLVVKNDELTASRVAFPVRPSDQMNEIHWIADSNEPGKIAIRFTDKNTGFSCEAMPKGAKLQFSRPALEKWHKRYKGYGCEGYPLPYFNISWELKITTGASTDVDLKKALHKGRKDDITGIEPVFGWFFDREKAGIDKFEKALGLNPGSGKPPAPLPELLKQKEKLAYGYAGLANRDQNPRFIAIDLGVRTFASCSVFRLQPQKPKAGPNGNVPLYREIRPFGALEDTGDRVYAVHERSFKIDLPGDRTTPALEAARQRLEQHRQELKYRINARRALRRIGLIDEAYARKRDTSVQQARLAAIEDFISTYTHARNGWPFSELKATDLIAVAKQHGDKKDEKWKKHIEEAIIGEQIEPALRQEFRDWRKASRQQGQKWYREQREARKEALKARWAGQKDRSVPPVLPFYGQSFWGINELTEARKLMLSYHTRSPEGGKGRSTGLDKGSRFAIKLQEHIQNRKEDRLKKGAHAIVMHALGYEWVQCDKAKRPLDKDGKPIELNEHRVPVELEKKGTRPSFLRTGYGNPYITNGTWVALHPPAQTVIFEDLSRYRTREDRSRAENSQLMKWAHRAIPAQVHMQGAIYGLLVGEVGAAFSSRFHAKTGAPGVRCNIFTRKQLELLSSQIDSAIKSANEAGKNESSWREYAHQWPLLQFKNNRSFSKEAIENLITAIDRKIREQQQKGKNREFGVLLPATGGEFFVTYDQNTGKLTALNADLNAAQNLALRFLSRYQTPEKVNFIAEANQQCLFSHTGSRRVIRQTGILKSTKVYFRRKEDLETEQTSDTEARAKEDFEAALASKWFSITTEKLDTKEVRRLAKSQTKEKIEEDSEAEANDDELLELKGVYSLFQDRSGSILPAELFHSAFKFWSIAKQKLDNFLIATPLFRPVPSVDNKRDGS